MSSSANQRASMRLSKQRQSLATNLLSENFNAMNLNKNNSLGGNALMDSKLSMGVAGNGRMSMYSAGRPSISNPHEKSKDSRPIKDKRWQQSAIQRLIQFLIQTGFPMAISTKTLQSPSSKDFQAIFKFLYSMLDPHYEYEMKKFEEEVPVLIKALRYPYSDQITKQNLFTVASLHAWPALLGMLVWMVDLILAVDQSHDESSGNSEQQQLTEAEQADKMFFDYIAHAYTLWIKGASDEVIEGALLENFEKKDGKVKKDMEKLGSEFAILEKEWNSLTQNDSPLTILERERQVYQTDIEKFKTYISHVEGKKSKLTETCKSLQEEFDSSEENVKKFTKEREELQATVDAQEISPADVDRMNAERDQLAKSLSLMTVQLDQVTKTVWNEEIALQKKMDSLERAADKFNTLLYKLDLLGSTDMRYTCVSKEIELFVQQSRPDAMVSVNLKQKVKPALENYIQSFKDNLVNISDDTIALQEKMDILSWSITKKEEEVAAIVTSIKILNERYNQEKDQIGQGLTSSTHEIDQMERQMQQLKVQTNSILNTTQSELKRATAECDEKTRKLYADRDQLMAQAVKALSTVFSFEQHISHKLDDFEGHVRDFFEAVEEALQE